MYAEKHPFQNRVTRGLQTFSGALVLLQLTAFLGAETGLPWIPLGYTVQISLLLFTLFPLVFLHYAGLCIRVSTKGWTLQLSPFHFYHRFISWEEINTVRLMKPEEMQESCALKGFHRASGQTFLISNPAYDVWRIELIQGFKVYLSIRHREDMIAFLEHGLLKPELKKKVRI